MTKLKLPENQSTSSERYQRPATIDREQLEYTFTRTLSYGVIVFAVVGVCASVAYLTVQQLKK